jgi:hypothetical protein
MNLRERKRTFAVRLWEVRAAEAARMPRHLLIVAAQLKEECYGNVHD